ncbi:MAG: hypothetical protein JNN15_02980 [Blastocatellia bacterium]|nr:hypothetical protein [Blastocatellia bacterium]
MSDQAAADSLDEFVNTIIEYSGLELSVDVSTYDDQVDVEIRGNDIPLLLGHNGELLNALEYLATKILGRHIPSRIKINFDSEGYRKMREKELTLMAQHAAERVRATKRPFTFEPMTPLERRIVHVALAEQTDIKTESQGEGEDRKVIVFLAN